MAPCMRVVAWGDIGAYIMALRPSIVALHSAKWRERQIVAVSASMFRSVQKYAEGSHRALRNSTIEQISILCKVYALRANVEYC